MPFCYNGGTARAEGIGEILTSIPFYKLYFVIVKEGEKQSTGAMYNLLDSKTQNRSADITPMITAFNEGNPEKIAGSVYNAFELCWDMEKMLSVFDGFAPSARLLSGSGPAVVALFKDSVTAKKCCDELQKRGINAYFAESVSCGSVIE